MAKALSDTLKASVKSHGESKKPAPVKKGRLLHSFWQPGYHSVFQRLRPYGFASPSFDRFALGIILLFDISSHIFSISFRFCIFVASSTFF